MRIHLLQNWFSLNDPAMEEALYEITSMRQFARLTLSAPIPEDTTIMNFRHLLEKHQLAAGILETINAYLRDRGCRCAKVPLSMPRSSMRLVRPRTRTASAILKCVVCADAGYTGVEKRPEHEGLPVIWQIAARRSTYKHLSKRSVLYKAKRKIEKAKAQVRAKVEHPFRMIKRQFGYVKTRFRGLAKNTAQLTTLFALSNLWMVRRQLLPAAGEVRP